MFPAKLQGRRGNHAVAKPADGFQVVNRDGKLADFAGRQKKDTKQTALLSLGDEPHVKLHAHCRSITYKRSNIRMLRKALGSTYLRGAAADLLCNVFLRHPFL